MTGAEMLAYVKSTFKRTDKDSEIYQAMLDTIMDMRLRFHSEDFKYESYASIANIGDYKMTLPDDFAHLIGEISIEDTETDESYGTLHKISKSRYDELYPFRTTTNNRFTGVPIHFCLYGRELFVGPCVDKETYRFQVNYTTEDATEITASTVDVAFSRRHRKTLRYGIMKELYLGLENYQEADIWSNLYEADLIKIIRNDISNISDNDTIQYHGV